MAQTNTKTKKCIIKKKILKIHNILRNKKGNTWNNNQYIKIKTVYKNSKEKLNKTADWYLRCWSAG